MPKAKPIDVELMQEWFYYDETSPSCLRWRKSSGVHAKVGNVSGYINRYGYCKVSLKSTQYMVHRIVLTLHKGLIDQCLQVDHIDGIRSNNKISNLRLVDSAKNQRNKTRQSNNKTGHNGIQLIKARNFYIFRAEIGGKILRLTKSFSVNKYGYEEALRLAIEWRETKIKELNEQGAGYTERHGADTKD